MDTQFSLQNTGDCAAQTAGQKSQQHPGQRMSRGSQRRGHRQPEGKGPFCRQVGDIQDAESDIHAHRQQPVNQPKLQRAHY